MHACLKPLISPPFVFLHPLALFCVCSFFFCRVFTVCFCFFVFVSLAATRCSILVACWLTHTHGVRGACGCLFFHPTNSCGNCNKKKIVQLKHLYCTLVAVNGVDVEIKYDWRNWWRLDHEFSRICRTIYRCAAIILANVASSVAITQRIIDQLSSMVVRRMCERFILAEKDAPFWVSFKHLWNSLVYIWNRIRWAINAINMFSVHFFCFIQS